MMNMQTRYAFLIALFALAFLVQVAAAAGDDFNTMVSKQEGIYKRWLDTGSTQG